MLLSIFAGPDHVCADTPRRVCFPPACRGLQPISAELVRSYRARMAVCLGFSAAAVASLGSFGWPPQPALPSGPPERLCMLLVNRRYSAGRTILNIGEVHDALQQRYGAIAEVQLRHMEGLTLRCEGAGQLRMRRMASLCLATAVEQSQALATALPFGHLFFFCGFHAGSKRCCGTRPASLSTCTVPRSATTSSCRGTRWPYR